MSEKSVVVCKPTQWIKIRAVLIILMFSVFAYLFYTDGTKGYRKKNVEFLMNRLITVQAVDEVQSIETEAEWKAFASTKVIELPDAEECPLPADFDASQTWPEIVVNGYDVFKEGSNGPNELWKEYAGKQGWGIDPPEHLYKQSQLNTQYYMAAGSAALALTVLFLLLRTLTRNMSVTDSSYIAPGGVVVPFSSMKRIDTRKWDNKGVAVIDYDDAGTSKKVKVDGMIYGQFKKEDGAPAEKLYQFILENFKGEVVEFEKVADDATVATAAE